MATFEDFMRELQKAVNSQNFTKKKKEEENDSVMDYIHRAFNRSDDDIAPVVGGDGRRVSPTNTAPKLVGKNREEKDQEINEKAEQGADSFMGRLFDQKSETSTGSGLIREKKRTWFNSGAFSDGYNFGDITKTILGTGDDIADDVVAGALGIGEKAVDAFAYGAGKVGDLIGDPFFSDDMAEFIKRDLYDEEAIAKKINKSPAKIILGLMGEDDSEKLSVAGEKTDSLAQSGGQLAGQIALQSVGVPWFVTSGVSSFGGEAENALNQGASFDEAGWSAAISAGAEILTEKLFGGSGLGEKGLINLEPLTRGISNKAVKVLADYGLDIAAEGSEEVVSEVVGNLASSLYKEENLVDLLLSEEAVDGYIEAFIGGSFLGGTSNFGKAIHSSKTGRDYRTGLNADEQTVIDKMVEDEIAKAEKDGKKVKKSDVVAEITERLEKGFISVDDIERILGGDSYNAYTRAKDSFMATNAFKEYHNAGVENQKLTDEFEALKKVKRDDSTLGDEIRVGEIQKRLGELKTRSEDLLKHLQPEIDHINAMKGKLRNEVSTRVKDGKLSESYRELVRSTQKFQADPSKYKSEAAKKTIQNLVDGGIANNTNEFREFAELMAKIADDKGVVFDITDNKRLKGTRFAIKGATTNAFVTEDGNITINKDSKKRLNSLVGHEITHVLEGTEFYTELQNAVRQYAQTKGEWDGRLESVTDLYKKYKPDADPVKELTADLIGEYIFNDRDFVMSFSTNKNVFQKVFDEIKYLAKIATAGSKEARDLARVKRVFEEVWKSTSKKPTKIEHSLGEIVDDNNNSYGIGVYLDSTLLDGLSPDERLEMVKEYVKELGGESFTAYDSNGNAVDITIAESNARFKNHKGNKVPAIKDLTTKHIGNEVKQEAVALVDEIVVAAEYDGSKMAKYPHGWLDNNGQNDWEYWRTYIQDKNNTIWEATLNIANAADGRKILYDIGPIKKVGQAVKSATIPTNNIPQSTPVVKDQFSLSKNNEDNAQGDIAPVGKNIPSAKQAAELENIAPIADARKISFAELDIPYAEIALIGEDRAKPESETKTAEVLTEEPRPEKKKTSLWKKFVTAFGDKGNVFETLSLKTKNRELQARYNSLHYAEGNAQTFIGEGAEGVRALNDIRKQVESSGKTQQFYWYIYHLHNSDRMSLAQRGFGENKAVFGDSVTAEQSLQAAAQIEAANPEFRQLAVDMYNVTGYLRQMMVDNGIISQETANLWAQMYPHYVPIRREGDEGLSVNVALDTNKTGVNAPIKRATGGNRNIMPLFDTMAQRVLQTYKAVAKNRFGVELKNTLGTVIEKSTENVDGVLDSIDKHEDLLQKGDKNHYPTFTVFENGERVTFEITEEMFDAMKPTSEGLAATIKPLNAIANLRRNLITEYNPVFLATNAIKDAQDILINSQHAAKTYMNLPLAAWQTITNGRWYKEYMTHGGAQNTYFERDTNTFAKEKSTLRKVVGFPLDLISSANNFIERLPRLAEYMASRKEHRSIDVSMLDAARVTTNFAAGGDVTKLLNRNGATFLNASVQGFMQNVRNVREAKYNGLKGIGVLAAKFAIAGLPAMLLNHLMWEDDEEYEELSDYVKENYYIVGKFGDGQFVRIPKGRMVAVIQSAFEQIGHLATGDDEADLKAFGELLVNNLAPNNPVDNNIFSPIAQAASNTTWYGEDLVPRRLQDLPAAEQYDESTDAISRWLGEKLNVSPVKINYLLDQYSGGLGDTFLPMLTPKAERGDNSLVGNLIAPWNDKFTTDSVMNNQNISDFYDTKDELAVNANASTATDEDILMSMYMNSVNAEMSELYAKKRRAQNWKYATDERKYERVREIQEQINAVARNGLKDYTDVSIDGDYATVGDRYFQRNEDGEWQKMSDEQVAKFKVTSRAGDAPYATDGKNHYRWYEPGEDSNAEPGWRKITDKELKKQKEVTKALGINPVEYWGNKEEYDYAYQNPGAYAVAKAVGGYDAYMNYRDALNGLGADKDEYGRTIDGSRKAKYADYIYGLDIPEIEKHILFKSYYNSFDDYNYEIIEYLNNRDDILYEEMKGILVELGFTVHSDGVTITWD